MKIRLLRGRDFSSKIPADSSMSAIVNEAFVKKMGWTNAIGKKVEGYNRKASVVGVVKNYNYKSLHNAVDPIIIGYNTFPPSCVSLKTDPQSIPAIAAAWKTYFPSLPFEYEFLDEAYAKQYEKDRVAQTLFSFFTLFAIIISAMGLFGLVSLMAVQRSKEVSVRKVLGASISQLLSLLSRSFVRLILLASVISIPVSWFTLNKWLSNYAFHVQLSWWMFVLPVVLVLLVSLLVISQQVIRAALANPITALRNE